MHSPKDPEEEIVITFDFSDSATTVESPEISIEVVSGTDTSPQSMLSGQPQIAGNKVTQKIIGGVNGADYHFRCKVTTDDGSKLINSDTLRVRNA